MERYLRTEVLIGKDAINKLRKSKVIVFGVGGVGGHAVEALVRSGIENITIVDKANVIESNLNRQIIATTNTVGMVKVQAMKDRIMEINPEALVEAICLNYNKDTTSKIDLSQYDYIVDAIDTVSGKLLLIEEAKKLNKPIISSMGAGNKIKPELLEVSDISKTSICPLARVMRRELKKRNIKDVKVVYSKEEPIEMLWKLSEEGNLPGSTPFVPACAGIIIASQVVRDLIQV